jgi:hypothetical protein
VFEEEESMGAKEVNELIERIKNGQVFETKSTENLKEAEKWQADDYRTADIFDGKLIMKKELEKILFKERFLSDPIFKNKVLNKHTYTDSELMTPMALKKTNVNSLEQEILT